MENGAFVVPAMLLERWYSKPEMVKDHRVHVPFSVRRST